MKKKNTWKIKTKKRVGIEKKSRSGKDTRKGNAREGGGGGGGGENCFYLSLLNFEYYFNVFSRSQSHFTEIMCVIYLLYCYRLTPTNRLCGRGRFPCSKTNRKRRYIISDNDSDAVTISSSSS